MYDHIIYCTPHTVSDKVIIGSLSYRLLTHINHFKFLTDKLIHMYNYFINFRNSFLRKFPQHVSIHFYNETSKLSLPTDSLHRVIQVRLFLHPQQSHLSLQTFATVTSSSSSSPSFAGPETHCWL